MSLSGQITWWVLVQENQKPSEANVSVHLGAAPWARISLSRAATISLLDSNEVDEGFFDSYQCFDMKISLYDPNSLLVATGQGYTQHVSRHGTKLHPNYFASEYGKILVDYFSFNTL